MTRSENRRHGFCMDAHAPNSVHAYWRILRDNRNYRLLWFAQIVSEVGDWLYSLAIYNLLLELTGSARAVAVAVVLQLLPQVFVGPLAGVLNDRLSRRKIMIAADLSRFVVVGLMLWAGRTKSIALIYILLGLETVLWAFFEPGRTAIVANIVRDEREIATATALSAATWSANFSVGAALGGIIGVSFGYNAVFLVNSSSFLVSAILIVFLRVSEPHTAGRPPFLPKELIDFKPYAEGARYITRDPRLTATLLVKAAFGALGIHWVILPIFGSRIFPLYRGDYTAAQASLLGMSILTTARGAGALFGPLAIGRWTGENLQRLRRVIGLGFVLLGAGYIGLAAAPSIAFAVAALIVLAGGASTAWTFSTTLLQLQVEDRFRGRVFSADFSLLLLTMSVVSYAAGLLIDRGASVRTLAFVTGGSAFLPAILWWRIQYLWRPQSAATPSPH